MSIQRRSTGFAQYPWKIERFEARVMMSPLSGGKACTAKDDIMKKI